MPSKSTLSEKCSKVYNKILEVYNGKPLEFFEYFFQHSLVGKKISGKLEMGNEGLIFYQI